MTRQRPRNHVHAAVNGPIEDEDFYVVTGCERHCVACRTAARDNLESLFRANRDECIEQYRILVDNPDCCRNHAHDDIPNHSTYEEVLLLGMEDKVKWELVIILYFPDEQYLRLAGWTGPTWLSAAHGLSGNRQASREVVVLGGESGFPPRHES